MTTMMKMHIPNDIIIIIFSKLPAKSLIRFRWLCKYWFKVITDPYFVKMHHINNVHATNNSNPLVLICSSSIESYGENKSLDILSLNSMGNDLNSTVNPDSVHMINSTLPYPLTSLWDPSRILGSCNGLVCIKCQSSSSSSYKRQSICIWNPCTKEYKMISQNDLVSIPESGFITYGFGYDCSIEDYKLIGKVYDSGSGYILETLVYTLGTSSLKKLYNSGFFLDGFASGLFINGDLYWKAKLTTSEQFNIIVAFDIVKEEYRQITKPPFINMSESYYSMHLAKLKGCLCVLNNTANWKTMEVWVMNHKKEEYSWDILYTISAPPGKQFWHVKVLGLCENGEIAMVMNWRNLILYDPKYNRIRFLPVVGKHIYAETYIESLVPVKGGILY